MTRQGIHKGIVLAGGSGSRMYPVTLTVCKQLLPVYDKPMVYYPLSTLIQLGIDEILFISTPQDIPRFQELLGDGHLLGLKFSYAVQEKPDGIAQALVIGERFIGNDHVALILGDNIFYGDHDFERDAAKFTGGAVLYAYAVNDASRYGVITFDVDGKPTAIDEKPKEPSSSFAVTGLYLYDSEAVKYAKQLRPSGRSEYEITDVNKKYLEARALSVIKLGRGFAWLDTGTHESLLEAGEFIATIEKRQGLKVGSIEESAFRSGRIDAAGLAKVVESLPAGAYKHYLQRLAQDRHE
jgi:glucose-1-phosphate thymidylyltransferase